MIYFKEFDISRIHNASNIACIARRKGGKKFLEKDLLFNLNENVKDIEIFSPIEEVSPFFSDFVPKKRISGLATDSDFRRIIELQKKNKSKKVCLFQDHTQNDLKSRDFITLFVQGKKTGLSNIIGFSSVFAISPSLRQNFDVIFIFSGLSDSELKEITRGIDINFSVIKKLYKECTNEYGTLVLNQGELFFYKAKITHNFTFACIDKPSLLSRISHWFRFSSDSGISVASVNSETDTIIEYKSCWNCWTFPKTKNVDLKKKTFWDKVKNFFTKKK